MSRLVEYWLVIGFGDSLCPILTQSKSVSLFAAAPSTKQAVAEGGGADIDDDAEGKAKRDALMQAEFSFDVQEFTYEAKCVDRFPLTDYKDSCFPPGLEMFCLPHGLRLTTQPGMPKLHNFAATLGNGTRLYGVCLTFQDEVSQEDLVDLLRRRHRLQLVAALGEKAALEIDALVTEKDYTPLLPTDKVYGSKCICILSQHSFLAQYRTAITEIYRLSLTPETVPLERTVCNFMTEVPNPPAGCTTVQYDIADKVVLFKRPPPNNPLFFSHFRLRLLFECLDVNNVQLVMEALLSERRILLVSAQLSALTIVTESLTRLMYPFNWHHVYIPLLPKALIDFVCAPYPFLIGTHTSFLEQSGFLDDDILADAVIVFLDDNKVVCKSPPQHIPSRERKKLVKSLVQMQNVFKQPKAKAPVAEHRMLETLDDAFQNAPLLDDEIGESNKRSLSEQEIIAHEADLREAYFRVFVSLFKDYRQFLNMPNSDQMEDGQFALFNNAGFLKTCASSSMDFVKAFLDTQAFSKFIEERVFSSEDDPSTLFFDESILKKRNRSAFSKKKPTPFLDRTDFAIKQTYIVPDPDMRHLESGVMYRYNTFPKFNAELFIEPRNKNPLGIGNRGRASFTAQRAYNRRMSMDFSSAPDQVVFTIWFVLFTQLIEIETNPVVASQELNKAFDILALMEGREIRPEEEVFHLIMHQIKEHGTTSDGIELANIMQKQGYAVGADIYSTLLLLFSTQGSKSSEELEALNRLRDDQASDGADDSTAGPPTASRSNSIFDSVKERPSVTSLDVSVVPDSGDTASTTASIAADEGKAAYTFTLERKRTYVDGDRSVTLFEYGFPGLTICTECKCPECEATLSDSQVRVGWSLASNDYTTRCPDCAARFVARFVVSAAHGLNNMAASGGVDILAEMTAEGVQEYHCEYLSPRVLKKEVLNLLKTNTAGVVLTDGFRREKRTLFWNLNWHFSSLMLPKIGSL